MSFMRTLATLAVGFAAARGVDKFRKMGGMEGMKDALRDAGNPGGYADRMGEMAERYNLPGGRQAMSDLMTNFSKQALGATEATEAGLGSLMSAMTGAASAGARGVSDMMGGVLDKTAVGGLAEENAKLMIRAMIQAAKADGEIDADERKVILDHLGDAGDEEMAFVQAALDAPLDPVALAEATQDHAKAQVYAAALMPVSVDTDGERRFLARLATALGLDQAKVDDIHTSMGKPAT